MILVYLYTVKDEMECSKVLVRNLPEAANEVGLKMYFEMRKNGGGPVKSVEINRSDKTAIVDFKNPEGM